MNSKNKNFHIGLNKILNLAPKLFEDFKKLGWSVVKNSEYATDIIAGKTFTLTIQEDIYAPVNIQVRLNLKLQYDSEYDSYTIKILQFYSKVNDDIKITDSFRLECDMIIIGELDMQKTNIAAEISDIIDTNVRHLNVMFTESASR